MLIVSVAGNVLSQKVDLYEHDATVWSTNQTIEGRIENAGSTGVFFVDSTSIPFVATEDSFSVTFQLDGGVHAVYACAADAFADVCSDTLALTLGFDPKPEVFAWPIVADMSVELHAAIIDHPGDAPFLFSWTADPRNPMPLVIQNGGDSVATVVFPETLPAGEYFFDVEVENATGALGKARTFVTWRDSALVPFDIWTDCAAWIDSAIVYEVTPYNFVANGGLQDVRVRLSELSDLGINTLWIQPLFETPYGGQGYDVSNYFRIRSDYGTAGTLKTLITVAHNLGMKVILDFVPNHTSIHHPYASDAIEYGRTSHYFDFYQRKLDHVRYSGDYHQRIDGLMTFTYYFWTDLVNLNYDHPEVRRWITEAGQYWIEEFDIDGYRIDAVWGVNARRPEAMQQWRFDLKRIKPELLLLGEDKATRPESFERRFDVAYDWYPEEYWVSHWTWQYDYSTSSNPTLFNHPNVHTRSGLLRDALTNRGEGFHPKAKVFRFMENNDTFRFAATHKPDAVKKTRMASTLLFTLPGIPMLYNGQEIGFPTHPYSTFAVYEPHRLMERQDRLGLYPHYRYLTQTRRRFPVFTLGDFEEVTVSPANVGDHVYSFKRSHQGQHALVVINMGNKDETASLDLATKTLDLPGAEQHVFTSLMTGASFVVPRGDVGPISIDIPAFSTDVFIIAEEALDISLPTAIDTPTWADGRRTTDVYPNPFAAETTIGFHLDDPGHVSLSLYDVLGRKVQQLVDRSLPAGRHRIPFDGSHLASGSYVYLLEIEGTLTSGVVIKTP